MGQPGCPLDVIAFSYFARTTLINYNPQITNNDQMPMLETAIHWIATFLEF